ncbi:MAG: tol-pal system protein YbgF [Bilophila wadsworthia]
MKKPYIFPLLLGSLVLTGCANGQIDAMQMRLNQQEQQIRLLNSQLSGVQPAQADTWAQVQSLRQEMSAVKGQIDDFNNATAAAGGLPGLAQRVNNHEAALQAIATQFGMELPVPPFQALPALRPACPTPRRGPRARRARRSRGWPLRPQQAAPQTQAQGDIAKALYDNGVQSFNARNYKQALKSFSDFTDTYGKHKLVSNAWFWRGECNYQLGNFPAAALDYEQVISKYGSSGKAASAYLKQGMCFIKAGKKDAAKVRLQELIKKFPKSPEATRATQLMKDNKM